MTGKEGKSNFAARLWNYITVQFSSEGGGIGSFLTGFIMFIVFVIVICIIFRNTLDLIFLFLFIVLLLMDKYINKFFGLAEKNSTQKLFYPPDLRMKALNWEYKYGSDKKALDKPKQNTKLGQPQFKNKKGEVVETGVVMNNKK